MEALQGLDNTDFSSQTSEGLLLRLKLFSTSEADSYLFVKWSMGHIGAGHGVQACGSCTRD